MTAILINEPLGFPLPALQRLRTHGEIFTSDADYPAERIEAVFVRLRENIGRDFHARHPRLRYIVSPTTGVNHLDMDYCAAERIEVITLRGHTAFLDHIHATAEHTLALTLALTRRIVGAQRSVAAGEWNRYPFQGSELHGKRVFLIGYGRVARQVTPIFQAFGCTVEACDRDMEKVPPPMRRPMAEGLAIADIVSLHVNLEPSNRSLLTAALLQTLRPEALFVNTSRGEIIEQHALFEMLAAGKLRGAALDVLADEPAPLSADVRDAIAACGDRLLITPHISGFTAESLEAVETFVTQLLCDALAKAR